MPVPRPDSPVTEPTVVQAPPPAPAPIPAPAPPPSTPPASPRQGKAVSIPKAAIASIVVVALVLAGVLVWALTTRGSGGSKAVGTTKAPTTPSSAPATSAPSPTTSASPSASSNGFPDVNEQALLAHIPADIARTCTRYTAPLGSPIASVYCVPYPGENDVQYNLYSTVDDMNQAYAAANTAGITGGDCSTQTTAEYPWYFSGSQTAGGRILCFRTAQNASAIYWTYDNLQIMAWTSRADTDNKALYKFWLTAGPNA